MHTNLEELRSPFQYVEGTHVPEELAIDLGHLASHEVDAIPEYLKRLRDRDEHPETYERYMGAIQESAIVYDALWTEQNIDTMTGLFNKASWERQLAHRVQMAVEDEKGACELGDLAVFVLDLDRFKLLNDTLGHAVGDVAITRVGEYLHNNLRKTGNKQGDTTGHQAKRSSKPATDHDGSHWGGDEYAVTAYFQPAGEDKQSKGRRKGRMESKERAEAIASRLEAGIKDVEMQIRAELLADPLYADRVAEMESLFGVTIGWAVRKRGKQGKLGQTAREFFEAADGDLERRKKEKKAALDETLDPETAAEIAAAEALLRKYGKIR